MAFVRKEKTDTASITIRMPKDLAVALAQAQDEASSSFGLGSDLFSRNQLVVRLLWAGIRHAKRVGYKKAFSEE